MRKVLLWVPMVTLLLTASCSKDEGDAPQVAARDVAADRVAVPGPEGTPVVGYANDASTTPGPAAKIQPKKLGAIVDLIVADAAALARTEFDPAALANQLGNDPQVLFEWVRDHTWWVPYRGLLRGSKGVMLDRVGSNLDRAVLLADLLRRAGHTVRLARAQLPEALAAELLANVLPIPDERRAPSVREANSAEPERATEVILPDFEESLAFEAAESRRLTDEATALIRSQVDQIYQIVRDIADKDTQADEHVARAAISDYWWVEREDGGRWIAMDGLLGKPGLASTLGTNSQRYAWPSTEDIAAIPEGEWHAVQIRVVVERYEGGRTTESVPLQTTLRPAQVFDRPILLRHIPRPWPEELPDIETDPNALGNAAVNVKEWVPFLQIGDEFIAQSGFTEGGDLVTDPFAAQSKISDSGGGGVIGGMDMALGGGETPLSYMTAEWIDYEIHVPGDTNQRLRRPVFDLLGPVKRAAQAAGFDASTNDLLIERYEALLSSTDILLQPCEFTEEFVVHLLSAGIVANQAALRELSQESDPVMASYQASEMLRRIDVWGPLPALVIWRSELGERPRNWFVDRPNVLNYRVRFPVVNADRAPVQELIDIASNTIGVQRGSKRTSFEARVHQGVADTVAEMLALGSDLHNVENTASVFSMATGVDHAALIGPHTAATVAELGWPEDAAARLGEAIDAGYVAIGLRHPVELNGQPRVGWWRVHPDSGATIGVMDTGLHVALTEDQIKRRDELRAFVDKHKFEARNVRKNAPNPQTWNQRTREFMRKFDEARKELSQLENPTRKM